MLMRIILYLLSYQVMSALSKLPVELQLTIIEKRAKQINSMKQFLPLLEVFHDLDLRQAIKIAIKRSKEFYPFSLPWILYSYISENALQLSRSLIYDLAKSNREITIRLSALHYALFEIIEDDHRELTVLRLKPPMSFDDFVGKIQKWLDTDIETIFGLLDEAFEGIWHEMNEIGQSDEYEQENELLFYIDREESNF